MKNKITIFCGLIVLFFAFDSNVNAKTLVITDSHGEGAFGEALAAALEQKGEEVSFYAVGGSSSIEWNQGLPQIWGYWEHHTGKADIRSTKPITPKLKDLLSTIAPDVLLIELGTNLIWREIPEVSKEAIKLMLATVRESGVKCYWVGPPELRPNKEDRISREYEIRNLLTQLVPGQGCELIQSWLFTTYPETGGDGIHYDTVPLTGKNLSREWAMGVANHVSP
jgi:hypothetical protein